MSRCPIAPRVVALSAVLLVAVLVLSGCGVGRTTEESANFPLSGERLTIVSGSGEVDLRAGDVDRLSVTRWFTGDGEATWRLEGGTLTLGTDCRALSSCHVRYTIVVPKAVAVTVTGANGDVTATGTTAALTIRTDNGGITVRDTSGDLDLRSSSGAQRGTGLRSAKVTAEAENGEIGLTFAEPPANLAVTTDNGAVTATLPDVEYDVTVRTESGEVRSELTEGPGRPVAITTGSGAVRLAVAEGGVEAGG